MSGFQGDDELQGLPDSEPAGAPNTNPKLQVQVDDELFKMLNLTRELLHSILPFVIAKIDRVSYTPSTLNPRV